MAIYSLGQEAASIPASGSAMWEIRTASANRAVVREIVLTDTFPTSGDTFGFGRPAAIGVTPTSPVTWLAEDPADPVSTIQSALAWGTGPTVPANFFRRVRMFGSTWWAMYFPEGLTIGVSSSLVVWVLTLGATAVVQMYGVADE